MITAASVKGKIQGLIDKANETTGNADTDLTTAVNALVEGYGKGGGGDDLFLSLNNQTINEFVATEDMYGIRQYMFYGNATLKKVDLSKLNATKTNNKYNFNGLLGGYCFGGCTALETVILPEILSNSNSATWIGERAFLKCTGLKEFITYYLGYFSSASSSVFQYCSALEKVIIPNFTASSVNAVFSTCPALEIVDYAGGYIGNNWFQNDTKLKSLVIRSESVTNLSNLNAFTGTPFAVGGTGGRCFVSAELISQYQEATNWVTLYEAGTCTFLPLEEYTVDGTLTGEIDWDKLNALDEVTE